MMAFNKFRSIFWASRTMLRNKNLETFQNNNVRFMSAKRDKLYGNEEGHGEQKNEVRKEKYWRRRNPPRKGSLWREENGYDKNNALHLGAFSLIPDWTDENGEIGAPTPLQERLVNQNSRLINEVYEAAMMVTKAQKFEKPAKQNNDLVHSEPKPKN